MALLYLDEDVSVEVGPLLTGSGHDVIHAYDVNNKDVADTEHLLFAASSERLMVTHNRRDFEELHRMWLALNSWNVMVRSHSGILTTWGQIPAVTWATLINDFLAQNSITENLMWRWRRQQQEWEPVGW